MKKNEENYCHTIKFLYFFDDSMIKIIKYKHLNKDNNIVINHWLFRLSLSFLNQASRQEFFFKYPKKYDKLLKIIIIIPIKNEKMIFNLINYMGNN